MKKIIAIVFSLISSVAFAQYGESSVVQGGPRPFYEQASNPAQQSNIGWVYSKDVSGVTELFYMDSAGSVLQLTSGGGPAPGPFDQIIIDGTNSEALLVRKDADAGDVFSVDTTSTQIAVSSTGTFSKSFVSAGVTITPNIVSVSNSANRFYQASFGDNSTIAPIWTSLRARGTQASPQIVQSGDRIAAMLHSGFDGTDYSNSSGFVFQVDGTPGNNDIPGKVSVVTHDAGNSTAVVTRLLIENAGDTTFTRGPNLVNLTASTEDSTYVFDSSATKTFATGALTTYRDYRYLAPTIAFAGASTISFAFTHEFGSLPIAGANATFNNSVGQIFGSFDGSYAYGDSNTQAVVLMPQIPNGTTIVDRLVGFGVASLGEVSLGDQTRTVSEVNLVELGGNTTLVSTGAVTVSGAITLRAEALQAGTGVTLLNQNNYAARFYGGIVFIENSRLQMSQGDPIASAGTITTPYGASGSTNGGNTFEVSGNTTIDYITSTGWTNGSEITLIFQSNPTVTHNAASPTSTAKQILIEGGSFSATSGDILKLQLNTVSGVQAWRVISKVVL